MSTRDTQDSLALLKDTFVFETAQNAEQLESMTLESEQTGGFTGNQLNVVFRLMHTLKGSAAMMGYSGLTNLSHAMEDLFQVLKEQDTDLSDWFSAISDLLFESLDFIREELAKIQASETPDGDPQAQVVAIHELLEHISPVRLKPRTNVDASVDATLTGVPSENISANASYPTSGEYALSHVYEARIFFDTDCQMENVRAFLLIHALEDEVQVMHYVPSDIQENEASADIIRQQGFFVVLRSENSQERVLQYLNQTSSVRHIELLEVAPTTDGINAAHGQSAALTPEKGPTANRPTFAAATAMNNSANPISDRKTLPQTLISVPTEKLDKVIDLIGEVVIAESMITHSEELRTVEDEGLLRATQQLSKITTELQDVAMTLRMVPLATTFARLKRVVRDMSKTLSKSVALEIHGEDIDVDKNIIEHIADPLIHIIRNAVDHGIEDPVTRRNNGKSEAGTVTIHARNLGGDVFITVSDNGRGIDRAKVLQLAREKGLLNRPDSEYSDRDVYNMVLLPGFSTASEVTEFSGRGVGMDIVTKNVESIGGNVIVESEPGLGTTITMKLPLTMAIIDGMNIRVGTSIYTIPTTAIREAFRPQSTDVIRDPSQQEMMMLRGVCYPILRLHKLYNIEPEAQELHDGILVVIENDGRGFCLSADELVGKQQVVVKSLPEYLQRVGKMKGLSGCTLLGNGTISLILNPLSLMS